MDQKKYRIWHEYTVTFNSVSGFEKKLGIFDIKFFVNFEIPFMPTPGLGFQHKNLWITDAQLVYNWGEDAFRLIKKEEHGSHQEYPSLDEVVEVVKQNLKIGYTEFTTVKMIDELIRDEL